MIKFSIITITYNAATVFMRTADSVRAQVYPNVEHIIIDGASSDSTAKLAENYKTQSDSKDSGHQVIVISEPDKGIYDAMNKGRMLASGDYVCFLNAGDFFPAADTLSVISANARLEDIKKSGMPLPAVLYGDTDWVDNNGNFIRRRRLTPPENLTWKSFMHGMLVCHQAFYARTDIAKMTPYNMKYHFSADVDWCIRIMKEAELKSLPLVNVHATIANYQFEGQSTKNHRASLMERFDIMRRHYGLFSTVCMHIWFVFRAVIK
ncbi:MAG: glycosyltransferase [Prevotella sp.]|nr:glycosyltransferase [Prevotella sp.]